MSALLYADFIARRSSKVKPAGKNIATTDLHHSLMPFQAEIVVWAAQVGCPAVWADTGLGKTRMQLEWCRVMGETALVMTTLAVAMQTIEEAAKIGIEARYVRSSSEFTGPGIYVTNYEMAHEFDPTMFGAVVLDPFAGSGTTLAVATGHGRDAIGIDLDVRNVDLARDRIGPMFFEHANPEEQP